MGGRRDRHGRRIALLGGLPTSVIITFVDGLPELQARVLTSFDQIRDGLTTVPASGGS